MKKILLLLLFCSISNIGFGQIRLNSSKTEIKKEFNQAKYSLNEMNIDGIETISIVTERVNLLYMFDSDNICKICLLIPDTQGDLNYYVELYNRQYVVISDKEWKMYNQNGIAKIELIFTNNKPSFKWSTN